MDKVGHQAKLRQALRVVTKKKSTSESSANDNTATTTTTTDVSTPLTPSTMTVNLVPSPTTKAATPFTMGGAIMPCSSSITNPPAESGAIVTCSNTTTTSQPTPSTMTDHYPS